MTQPRLFSRGTGHQPTMPAVILPSVTSCTQRKEKEQCFGDRPHGRNRRNSAPVILCILHISYKHNVTNEEVRAKIQRAIGSHEDLRAIVKRRKLQGYGHVSRSSGLAKTIVQGTVKGGRRQGRQSKRWEDNIRERTGLEFGKPQRAVENREKWKKLVAESSLVPQRPSLLRD